MRPGISVFSFTYILYHTPAALSRQGRITQATLCGQRDLFGNSGDLFRLFLLPNLPDSRYPPVLFKKSVR